jgi:NTP pyrophosphatase (non-canonical NTP hydrolase)
MSDSEYKKFALGEAGLTDEIIEEYLRKSHESMQESLAQRILGYTSTSTSTSKLSENPLSIPNLQSSVRKWAIEKGWRGEHSTARSFGEDAALITSEVSEALEAFRESGSTSSRWFTYTIEVEHLAFGPVKFKNVTYEQLAVLLDCDTPDELDSLIEELNLEGKPEGVGPELADVAIRILDTCEEHGINLEAEIDLKMQHNNTRAFRHGGKHL